MDVKAVQSALNAGGATRAGTEGKQYMWVFAREDTVGSRWGLPAGTGIGDQRIVRRPLGLEFKRETYSYIEVVRIDPSKDNAGRYIPISIFNSNYPNVDYTTGDTARSSWEANAEAGKNAAGVLSGKTRDNARYSSFVPNAVSLKGAAMSTYNNNFIITSVQEMREEKFQILETFGDNFAFFFGERPRFFEVTGLLLNANSHNWEKEFWLNYDRFLRGTRAVEHKSIVTLHIDDMSVSGYLVTASAQKSSDNPRAVQFNFRMLVTDYYYEDGSPYTVDYFKMATDKRATAIRGKFTDNKSIVGAAAEQIGMPSSLSGETDELIQLAVKQLSALVFGDPLSALTDGVAGLVNIYTTMDTTGVAALDDLPAFRDGRGSLVSYNGKAIDMQTLDGSKTTLRQAGANRLIGSIDNSLNILLNLRSSPILKIVGGVGALINQAINLLGVSTTPLSLNVTGGRNLVGSGALVGNVLGFDVTLPMAKISRKDVSPLPTSVVVKGANLKVPYERSERVKGASYIDSIYTEFTTDTILYKVKVTTGSGVKFDLLKKDPNYLKLPRAWRLQIEKNPDSMSDKIIALSRQRSESDLELTIAEGKDAPVVETNVSKIVKESV